MKYYSTNNISPEVSLAEAVVKGLSPDNGLYMPRVIKLLPQSFFDQIDQMSFVDIACKVGEALFGEDIPRDELNRIVIDTLSFDCPIVEVSKDLYSLELFHGPTLAFKDVGARFMARMLQWAMKDKKGDRQINVLVATSGDTGSAVANGFLDIDGIHVYVLYPKGKVSNIQECQFTTLGKNITAIEIDGVFDDCQRLVKNAFLDAELNEQLLLTSANSINIARLLPQAFYYFNAYARLKELGKSEEMVMCVPSGNFGNITAGLFAYKMGLPIKRFIAANNANDVFYDYLKTGVYSPKASVATIANAMDVGAPSNFARILNLFDNSHEAIANLIEGFTFSDEEIRRAIMQCYQKNHYLLDPHGACGYLALSQGLQPGEAGVFLETAHPAKFYETVCGTIGEKIEIPQKLAAFMEGKKQSVPLSSDFSSFKDFLLS